MTFVGAHSAAFGCDPLKPCVLQKIPAGSILLVSTEVESINDRKVGVVVHCSGRRLR